MSAFHTARHDLEPCASRVQAVRMPCASRMDAVCKPCGKEEEHVGNHVGHKETVWRLCGSRVEAVWNLGLMTARELGRSPFSYL